MDTGMIPRTRLWNVSIRQLDAFVTLAEVGSFGGASGVLNISQSALSKSIQHMESALGITLFDRTTRRVELTQVGRDFLGPVRRILGDLNDTFSDVQAVAAGVRGTVSVACLYSIATRIIPRVLADFSKQHPNVTVSIIDDTSRAIVHSLEINEADIGVCGRIEFDDRFVFEAMLQDKFCAVVNKTNPLAKASRLTWSRLLEHPNAAMARGTLMRDQIDFMLRDQGHEFRPIYEASHYSAVLEIVAQGLAVAAMPELILESRPDDVVVKRLSKPAMERSIGIVTPKHRSLSPAAAAFRECLVNSLQRQYMTPCKPRIS